MLVVATESTNAAQRYGLGSEYPISVDGVVASS